MRRCAGCWLGPRRTEPSTQGRTPCCGCHWWQDGAATLAWPPNLPPLGSRSPSSWITIAMRALLLASGRAALQLGQVDRVRDLAEKGVEVARRSGEQPYVALHQALLGSLDLALGDSGAAAGRFRPLIGLLLAWRYHPSTQGVVPEAVEALIGAGELEEAAALLADLERDSRDPVTAALTARCRGALAAARGNLHAAAAELTGALRRQDLLSPQPLDRGRTLLVLGGVQRRLKSVAPPGPRLPRRSASSMPSARRCGRRAHGLS